MHADKETEVQPAEPFFTILIPVLNRVRDIPRALASCFRQSRSDYEIIIVDNGSTDGTYEYCRGLTDPRIVLLQCGQRGLAFARNAGIRAARGRWTILLDSDNYLSSETSLEELRSFIDRLPTGSLGVFATCVSLSGTPISRPMPDVRITSIAGYLESIQTQHAPTVRTSWFREHLYPEIAGSATEFPCCVWFDLAKTGQLYVTNLEFMTYGTDSSGRICDMATEIDRARELAAYYHMILSRFGAEIWSQAGKIAYASFLLKFGLYNRVAGSYSREEYKSFHAAWLVRLCELLPRRVIPARIDAYKRRKHGRGMP